MNESAIINACIEAYIAINGEAKWNRLTAEQQHDAIMIMIKDTLKALETKGE